MPAAHVGTCLDTLITAKKTTRPLHGMAQVLPFAYVRVYECGYGLLAGVCAGVGADVVVDGLGGRR